MATSGSCCAEAPSSRRPFIVALATACAAAIAGRAIAQPRGRIRRIAWVSYSSSTEPGTEITLFRHSLSTFGLVEPRDVAVRLWTVLEKSPPDLIAEVLAWDPDVIITRGTSLSRAMQAATRRIPVVFAVGGDPVDSGLVRNHARPGANVTGVHHSYLELSVKRLEMARELVPRGRRVGFLLQRTNPYWSDYLESVFREARRAGERLQFETVESEVREPGGVALALDVLATSRVDVVLPFNNIYEAGLDEALAAFQRRHRVPVIEHSLQAVTRGSVLGVEPDTTEIMRRAAALTARILAGAAPADLPVERIARYRLGVNLESARQMGLRVPESILIRADSVVR